MARLDLVIAFACLAIVAGIAIPRQGELVDEARRESVQALARNTGNVLALTRARWEQQGRPLAVTGNRGVVALVNGYPSLATLPLLLSAAETAGFTYDAGRWQLGGGADCGLRYAPPLRDDLAPELEIDVSGC